MATPAVSVLTSAYNAEAFIGAAIESILRHLLPPGCRTKGNIRR
jgi:glycosyltransferase involved in cell wall biosynthesis